MAAKRGPEPLSEAGLIEEIHTRLDSTVSKADVKVVVKALKEEIAECLQNGYKVTLTGLMIITPSVKPGRKKGDKVYNPFDGTTKTLRADEPPKFNAKASISSVVKNGFPDPKKTDGAALVAQLTPKKKVTKK